MFMCESPDKFSAQQVLEINLIEKKNVVAKCDPHRCRYHLIVKCETLREALS